MGSVYIMISIPSADHEKSILAKTRFGSQHGKKPSSNSVRPNKSVGDVDMFVKTLEANKFVIPRSLSDDSVMNKIPEQGQVKEHAQSAVYVSKNKRRIPMEKRLENCLEELKIPNAVWVLGSGGKYYQVSFCTPAGEQCESILQMLNEFNIGVELNSTVSILPCSLYFEGKEHNSTPNKASPSIPSAAKTYLKGVRELTAWEQFTNSVRARLMVAQVVSGVRTNALFTFDFLMLLIIASITAAVGLVENSVVFLVASMLISPLMGPVMASTFGFVTRDWKLQNIGVLNELLGLLLCVLIGFLYGLAIGYLSWESPDIVWPTPEMVNRGDVRSLWVGALIALLSGAAVAIAVLGDYSGSLTGVAISASLMPPAVNAGLLWALAVVVTVMGDSSPRQLTALSTSDPVSQLVVLGALSLTLTFVNIICIFLTGILVLKIKEVTPRGSKDYSRLLWKETIQIARDYREIMPQSSEGMEQGPSANQFSDMFFQHPYRMGMNQYTWSAYGGIQELPRRTVRDLASGWQPMTHTPGIMAPAVSPSAHANVARLWTVMSSPTYTSVNNIMSQDTDDSQNKRFVVTPANDDNILF